MTYLESGQNEVCHKIKMPLTCTGDASDVLSFILEEWLKRLKEDKDNNIRESL